MNYIRMVGRAVLGALLTFVVVLWFPLVTLMFVGSGDYTGWATKAMLVLVTVAPAFVMALTTVAYVRGSAPLSEYWAKEVLGLLSMNQLLALFSGVFLNVVTGRGELGIFPVVGAVGVLLVVGLGLLVKHLPAALNSLQRLSQLAVKPTPVPDPKRRALH